MAQLPDVLFDDVMVKTKRALAITTCAMVAAKDNEWFDHRPDIEYALWQVQENLCEVVLDMEETVDYPDDAYQLAIEDAARLVERFHDAPVVIQPNESFATTIARAIRQLAKNEKE